MLNSGKSKLAAEYLVASQILSLILINIAAVSQIVPLFNMAASQNSPLNMLL
jgi:hypothetical protein